MSNINFPPYKTIGYSLIAKDSEVPFIGGDFICDMGGDTKTFNKAWGVQVVKRVATLRQRDNGEYVLVIKFTNNQANGQIVHYTALLIHSDNLELIQKQYTIGGKNSI